MEKLIELLNEYEIEREKKIKSFKQDRLPYYEWSDEEFGDGSITYLWLNKEDYKGEELYGNSANAVLLSKHYGFIKWLVENDKIDKDKVKDKGGYVKMSRLIWDSSKDDVKKYWEYRLLMLLSISDKPIEDLILYLK